MHYGETKQCLCQRRVQLVPSFTQNCYLALVYSIKSSSINNTHKETNLLQGYYIDGTVYVVVFSSPLLEGDSCA